MITSKKATATATKCNSVDDLDMRKTPEFKRISKFVDGKIKGTSKSGRHCVFLTKKEISDAGETHLGKIPKSTGGLDEELLDELKNVPRENGFGIKAGCIDDAWGITINW